MKSIGAVCQFLPRRRRGAGKVYRPFLVEDVLKLGAIFFFGALCGACASADGYKEDPAVNAAYYNIGHPRTPADAAAKLPLYEEYFRLCKASKSVACNENTLASATIRYGKSLYLAGRRDEGLAVMSKGLTEKKPGIPYTYGTMIDAYIANGEVEKGRSLYREAQARGVDPKDMENQIMGLSKIDPARAADTAISYYLRVPYFNNAHETSSRRLRDVAAEARKVGRAADAARLEALAKAVDEVDGGVVKIRPTTAAMRVAQQAYAAAGAPEYANAFAEMIAEKNDSDARDQADAEEKQAQQDEDAAVMSQAIGQLASAIVTSAARRQGMRAATIPAPATNVASSTTSRQGNCRMTPVENFPRGNFDAGISLARSNCACMGGQLIEQRATLSASCVRASGSNGYQMRADGGWNGSTR